MEKSEKTHRILLDPYCYKQFDPCKKRTFIHSSISDFETYINIAFEKNPTTLIDGLSLIFLFNVSKIR